MDIFASSSFTMRPAVMENAAELTNLIVLCEQIQYPIELDYHPEYTVEDIQAEWQSMDLSTDTCIAFDPNGQIIGYLGVTNDFVDIERKTQCIRIQSFSCVHPDFVGCGIGTELLHFADTRARQYHPISSLNMTTWMNPRNERARRLLIKEGFVSDQHSIVEMRVELKQEPQQVEWPVGISVCTFQPGQDDVIVKSTIEESFNLPLTHWDQMYTNRANFDPTLWHLAWDGDQLAGVLMGVPNPTMGWVDMLGVRVAWRKRGIGQALLQHAIRDFYMRGLRTVALSVGVKNQFGALRLYERAGMQVGSQIDRYRKPIDI